MAHFTDITKSNQEANKEPQLSRRSLLRTAAAVSGLVTLNACGVLPMESGGEPETREESIASITANPVVLRASVYLAAGVKIRSEAHLENGNGDPEETNIVYTVKMGMKLERPLYYVEPDGTTCYVIQIQGQDEVNSGKLYFVNESALRAEQGTATEDLDFLVVRNRNASLEDPTKKGFYDGKNSFYANEAMTKPAGLAYEIPKAGMPEMKIG